MTRSRPFAIVRTNSLGKGGFVRAYLCRIGSQYCFANGRDNPTMVRFVRREDAEYERKQYGYAAASNIRVEKIA